MATTQDQGIQIIKSVLTAAQPRPSPTEKQHVKNQYAIRFADEIAKLIARDLEPQLGGIVATTRREAASARGKKQLDINFSTPRLGLAVGISLKSVHIREAKDPQRYTHNMKRNEEELRIEAAGYHKRQPYAVMVGVLWLPFDSCDDAKKNNPSSFGSWVRHLRPYAGRDTPKDDEDRFEKIYVGLYEPDGSSLRFFDIEDAPPKSGRPQRSLSYSDFLDAIYQAYLRRNHADFEWADAGEEPLHADEIEPLSDDEDTSQ